MTVAKTKPNNRQTKIKTGIPKSTTLSLLSRDKKRNKKSFKAIQYLHTVNNSLSKQQAITTQKQSKTTQSAHKLHRVQSVT